MPGLGALWDSLVDCICRPPRDEYVYPDELVGGRRGLFRVGRYAGVREDLTLVNKRGMRLQCSHYFPKHVRGRDGRLPCVIYCHCNSGSRRDAEEAICVLIPRGVSVFALDFAGSGLSEGQWVTLGAEEVDDVEAAVEHLRAGGRVSSLGLWGRSMGAVTALLYSQRDPSIAGMVLDSPFSRLTDLMMEIVAEQRLPIPRPLAKLALAAMKRSVSKRAGFDINKVSPVDVVAQSYIPALFGHAVGDTFIKISHAEALHAAYAGDKNLIRFDGDHNSRRPEFFYNSVSIFWHNTLQLEHLLEPADLPPMRALAAGAAATGPTAALAAAAGGAAAIAGAPLLAAQPRMLRPPSSSSNGGGGAAAAAAAASGWGPLGGSPHSQAAGRQGSGGASPAVSQHGGEGALGGGVRSSTGLGGGGGGGAATDDDAEDVSALGAAARSAPWEPRMWEWDLDRSLLERQRFRRMAGGLADPATSAPGPATGATGANGAGGSDSGPGGGGGATGGGATGGATGASGPSSGHRCSGFRNSTELAHLLSHASDSVVIAKLLGAEPNYGRSAQPPPPGAAAGAAAGATPGAGAAGDGGGGGGGVLGGAGSQGLGYDLGMFASSEEEEDAQLAAALQLSLMEATGMRLGESSPSSTASPRLAQGQGQTQGQGCVPLSLSRQASSSIAAAPAGAGLGARAGEVSGGTATAGGTAGVSQSTAAAASGNGVSTGGSASSAAVMPHGAADGRGAAAGAAAAGGGGGGGGGGAEVSLLGDLVPNRSLSLEEARPPARLQPLPAGTLSGPQYEEPSPLAAAAARLARPGLDPLLSAPAPGPALASPQSPSPSSAAASSSAVSAAASGSASAAASGPQGRAPPGSSGSSSGVATGAGQVQVRGGAAAAPAAAPAGRSGRQAVPGPSLYELYSEQELLALAVQLSLQEANAAAAAAPAAAAAAAAVQPQARAAGPPETSLI
ncbi:hypothetical protein HYH02_009833 [Chlamydomonas schloesseri]|uniref:Serine aminopeptidase S33 domain-containing protein n=1 Tax=Chlamydomonas schloesseri TaxID=2026947 RepID=A0A835TNA8_9CHLO|nr:hypothetical protein HYH02_009833 [Chlamydomonas schloesseri]|eukprot:KAG2442041.1 hypothetical protein HYH02_009833 [Chlamydomonas schloesseri]